MKDADTQIIATLREILARTGGGAAAVWGAITGTLGNQTDLSNALALKQTAAQVQALIDAAVPYKVYAADFTQSGTDAPTVTVRKNTLGADVVWTYNDTGKYDGTLAGAFLDTKVPVIYGLVSGSATVRTWKVARASDDVVNVSSLQGNITTDGLLNETFIEIRVCP